jgi:hypothetical protein
MRKKRNRQIPFDVFLGESFLGEFYFPQGTSVPRILRELLTAGFPEGINVRCRFTRKG